ncbi:hypothetical protein KQ51_00898 [Candidatus Izimaplasma bacterium HR1]|jgi:hypothetical protein|uniref:Pr6Pr family membrane protein n=1 Tax=Candidatus Izimoplasma sp. HR1 TaxID=1541959 RepID=UPI0004F61531|nr:hypothetical protein KQ51_00898 [Candidatus Izimaplasma bacterium HR1]
MKKYYRLLIVLVGTIGILSLVFDDAFIVNPEHPMMSLRLFKYFTVLSNLLAVIYFWLIFSLRVDEKSRKWKNLVGGVMIYTTITFLVFSIFLEGLYIEKNLALVGSLCLHYINPIIIIGYVITYRNDFDFKFSDSYTWIIFPVIYLIFLVIIGTITGDFLYPFFQVSEIGILGLMISIIGLIGLFFLLSFGVVKILSKKYDVFS